MEPTPETSYYSFIQLRSPVDINISFVEQRMEQVDGFNSRSSLLLVAKDQVDPFVKMCRDVIALQRRTMDADEFTRIVLGPRWQDDVVESHAALLRAQVKAVGIDQEIRQVEEFRNQLFDIGHVEFGSR